MTAPDERHPRGPEELKAMRDALGLSRTDDMLALSRQHDPYQCGTDAHWRDARWFAGLWEQFGYTRGVHLRRVHYQVVSVRGTTARGKPYENTEACWSDLLMAGRAARILGLVDPEAFTDQRNDPPRRYVLPREWAPEPAVSLDGDDGEPWAGWHVPSFGAYGFGGLVMPGVTASGYDYDPDDQPVLIEVWVEKSTMDDILAPLCRRLSVNLLSGSGFQSITAAIALLRRAEEHCKPAHVLYVSDFDPAGAVMPVSIARQAQFWAETLGIGAQLTLEPLVLTRGQVDEYDLPRVPVKVTDQRRARFEQVNGEGAVELDALEALHPGVLAQTVRHAVHRFTDDEIPGQLDAADAEADELAASQWDRETADLRAEMQRASAEISAIIERHRPQLGELNRELAGHRTRLADLARRVRDRAQEADWELPGRPAAEPPDVDTAGMLYDSRRHWLDQASAYRAAKNGEGT